MTVIAKDGFHKFVRLTGYSDFYDAMTCAFCGQTLQSLNMKLKDLARGGVPCPQRKQPTS